MMMMTTNNDDRDRVVVSTWVTRDTYRELQARARQRGMTTSAYLRWVLSQVGLVDGQTRRWTPGPTRPLVSIPIKWRLAPGRKNLARIVAMEWVKTPQGPALDVRCRIPGRNLPPEPRGEAQAQVGRVIHHHQQQDGLELTVRVRDPRDWNRLGKRRPPQTQEF